MPGAPTGGTVLWSPGTATPEPIPRNLCSAMGGTPAMEDLLTATRGYPVQQQRPSTAKNKYIKLFPKITNSFKKKKKKLWHSNGHEWSKEYFYSKRKKITLLNQQRRSSVYSKISDSSLSISSPFWISFCTDGIPHLSG